MQRKLTLELGYEPSVTELAEALDMSEDKVMEIMQIAREPASLETPIGEEDDSNLGDFVADSNVVTPEGNVESVMLREHIDALLGDLKERERAGNRTAVRTGGRTSQNTGRGGEGVQRHQRAYPSDRGQGSAQAAQSCKKQADPRFPVRLQFEDWQLCVPLFS